MEIKNPQFEKSAFKPEQYPSHSLPEIALVGRSNVGKSSLINTLVNRKNLARVANAPGRTREINFYNLDNRLYLVDLPGYGYAKVSKAEKAAWAKMIETYLFTREQLRLIIMLVDIRHAPSLDDQTMYGWLTKQDKSRLIVATKLDKISRGQVFKQLKLIRSTLETEANELVIPFSAETKQGRDEVWGEVQALIG